MRAILIAILFWCASSGVCHAALVTGIYELNGSYTDTLGGTSLSPAGGSLSATGFSFGSAQSGGASFEGLSLDNALTDAADYSIEMNFRWNDAIGWGKIIDFKNLVGSPSDFGLYTDPTNLLRFHSGFGNGTTPMPSGSDFHLVITRDGSTNLFTAYLNGSSQFSFTDTGSQGVFSGTNNRIWFFRDDGAPSDERSGFVDRIRIYDGALTAGQVASLADGGDPPGLNSVPEPSSILFFAGLGTAVLGFRRRGYLQSEKSPAVLRSRLT